MKTIPFTSILIVVSSLLSCNTEDARTPLGITVSAPDFEITIEEMPESDIVLGTLTAIASDESVIQFGEIIDEDDEEDSKFSSETPIDALDVDNTTGVLTIKDVSLFDYDENTEINAIVNAYSGSVSEAINITIFLTEILDINSDIEALIDLYNENITTTTVIVINDDGEEEEEIVDVLPDLDWAITDDEDIEITESDISTWEGVTLTDGRVTGLDVSNKGLTVIPDSLAKLDQLISLNISSDDEENQITELSDTICEAFIDIETFITDATCEVEETEDSTEDSTATN